MCGVVFLKLIYLYNEKKTTNKEILTLNRFFYRCLNEVEMAKNRLYSMHLRYVSLNRSDQQQNVSEIRNFIQSIRSYFQSYRVHHRISNQLDDYSFSEREEFNGWKQSIWCHYLKRMPLVLIGLGLLALVKRRWSSFDPDLHFFLFSFRLYQIFIFSLIFKSIFLRWNDVKVHPVQ